MLQNALETFSNVEAGFVLQQNNNRTLLNVTNVTQLHFRRRFILRYKLLREVKAFLFYKVLRIVALMGTVISGRGVTFLEDWLCFNTCHSYMVWRNVLEITQCEIKFLLYKAFHPTHYSWDCFIYLFFIYVTVPSSRLEVLTAVAENFCLQQCDAAHFGRGTKFLEERAVSIFSVQVLEVRSEDWRLTKYVYNFTTNMS
jgi:hypothetical protein